MNLPRIAVKRPITAAMMLITVLVVGGIAVYRIPLAYLPEVDVPFIGIEIPYPNSNPMQVEKEIIKPVEEVLSTLPGVKTLNATGTADQAEFFLEFDWGQKLDIVRMQVSEKMEQVKSELPSGIGEVVIFSFNTADIPVVQARVSAQGVDLSSSYDLIETRILNRIRRVPGVGRVDLDGVAPREINIDLILDRLREHNVDVRSLIDKLHGASSNLVLGQVDEAGLRFSARSLGAFQSLEEIEHLVIDERGLRLKDIAEITYEEPIYRWGRHLDREFAIALTVYKESTANTVDVVRQVQSVIKTEINGDPLLQGVQLWIWEDQAEEITRGLEGLLKAGTLGALLAIFSLYFFLRRLDSTFIVSLSIPFSILAAVGLLFFLGSNLNVLSMMGLMLAVGMLVDNAVVVLESIDRVHRREEDRELAALIGAKQVSVAVAAATLTTVIVFLPLVVGGKTDLTTWLKEIGIAITIALVCSLFSSLTLIPLMSAHFLGRRKARPIPVIARLEERYVRVLGWTLVHPWKTAGALVLVVVFTVLPFKVGLVESAIFSGIVNKRIFVEYEFDDFAFKSEAEKVVNQVEEVLEAHREDLGVESVYSFFRENYAATAITLVRKNMTDDEVRDLRKEIRETLPEVPGVRLVFDDDSQTGGSSTYFAVKFFGQDTAVLDRFADEAMRRLETVEGLQDLRKSTRDARREIEVRVDRDKAHRLGLTAQDLADVFSFTLGAMRLPRFRAGEREVETWLALRLEDRENLEDLRQLQVGGGNGGRPVLLGDIGSFEIVPRPREINRENRKVRVQVNATYEGEGWNETKGEIEGLMNAFDFPAGYSWSWNDRIVETQDQNQQMAINVLLALVLVYLVMASLFESLAQPFAILSSILFAFPGAAWMLAATGTKFNIMAWIGLLILMGIVVNNGIVLLDYVNQLRRQGLSREEAILRAGRERLRPILMTAVTTIIGLMPLAIRGPAAAGVFYYPLARTVMGGLFSSALLTLLALPFISVLMENLADWLRRLWRLSGSSEEEVAAAAPEVV